MTIVRQDTFTRANQSGWGTASDGNAWAASGTEAIASNEGCIGTSAASSFSTLGAALAGADAEGLVRFQIGGSTDTAGILLRWTNSSNHWLFRYDGAGHVAAMVKVSGTYTTLSPSYTFTPTNGTFYWLRARCQGTTIEFKVWQDGTSEPSSWTESYTSSSQNVAGNVGLYGFGHTSNSVKFDTYSVDDLQVSSNSWNQSETDAYSGLDTLSNQMSKPLSETQSALDTVSQIVAHALNLSLSDIHSGLDSVSQIFPIAWAKTIQDWQSGTDLSLRTLIKAWTQSVTDTHSALDTVRETLALPSGVGIGDLSILTDSISWSGGPTGSPGTETRVIYADSTSSGWAVGMVPTYGGALISPWYQLDANTFGANQTGMGTTSPDGHIHWLEQSSGGAFSGSEDVKYTLTELAPTGTAFRRYYQASFGPDANGFNWVVYVCIYPGDPGLIAYRFDCTNPSGTAKSLASSDSLEIALLGGLQQSDSTWNAANGGYGTVGGTNHVGWPASLTSIEPDYVYITPNTGNGVTIGQETVKHTSLSGLGWSSLQMDYLQASGASGRLKVKVQGTFTSFPGNTTQTVYLLNALRRNLTSTDAIAIAADYLAPGTPTTSVGSFTSYSYDERAYVYSASGNSVTTTLDLSPANVTVRYKPVLKLTGWTANAPILTWGGASLTAGVDYRTYTDTTNHICYIQLYFDVVSSGATAGQRNNAALAISPAAVSWTQTSTEQFSEQDTRFLSATHQLFESESALDAIIHQVLHLLPADWLSGSEQNTKQVQTSKGDLFAETDLRSNQTQTSKLEAFSETDLGMRQAQKARGDLGSQLDTQPLKQAFKTINEVASLTDAWAKATRRSIAEVTSALDTLTLLPAHALLFQFADLFSETDSPHSSLLTGGVILNKTISEHTSALDLLLNRGVTHYSADFFSVLDTWTRAWAAHLSLVELLSGQDALSRQVVHYTPTERLFAQDTLTTLRYRLLTLSESLSQTDQTAKQVNRAFMEALAATDAVSKQTLRTLFEQMSETDRVDVVRVLLHTVMDAFSLTETMSLSNLPPGGLAHLAMSTALLASALGLTIQLQALPVVLGLLVQLLAPVLQTTVSFA